MSLNDIKQVLLTLPAELGFKVKLSEDTGLIDVSGVASKKITFASMVDFLEKDSKLYPLSPFDNKLTILSAKLSRPGERLPLMIESFQKGAFRASCAYWLGSRKAEPIDSIADLKKRITRWDGLYPDAEKWQRAANSASQETKRRVKLMQEEAADQEKNALASQLNAARLRLICELGKYLICLGASTDELNESLFKQMSRDIASSGRLQKCIDVLGGYPE